VELANSRGAPDNVSVAVISIVPRHAWWKALLRKWTPLLVALLVSAGLLASITLITGAAGTAAPQSNDGPVPTPTTELTATATPQAQPTEAARSRIGHLVETANLRTSPRVTSSNVRGKLLKGQAVVILKTQVGDVPEGGTTNQWYEVQLPNSVNTGFVYSEFVSVDKASHTS
jgi:hypothetical protein